MPQASMRIQVLLGPVATQQVQLIAEAENKSLSFVMGEAWESYSNSDEFKQRFEAADQKVNASKRAVMALVADLPAEKQQQIRQALES